MQGLLTGEKKRVKELAMSLRSMRISSAKRLEERVNAVLAELGMEGFRIIVQINERDKVRSTGAEDVNFLLAVNGETTGPVSKCASGGELSRLLLALEIALPDDQLPRSSFSTRSKPGWEAELPCSPATSSKSSRGDVR